MKLNAVPLTSDIPTTNLDWHERGSGQEIIPSQTSSANKTEWVCSITLLKEDEQAAVAAVAVVVAAVAVAVVVVVEVVCN